MTKLTSEQALILDIAKNALNIEDLQVNEEIISNMDWDLFLKTALDHKVFLLAYKAVFRYLPNFYVDKYKQEYNAIINKINCIVEEIERVCKLADENAIRYVVFKGISFSKIIYDDIYARQFHDIDILVEEDDMIKLDYIIRKNDYFQVYYFDSHNSSFKLLPFPLLKDPGHHEYFEYCIKLKNNEIIKLEIARFLHIIKDRHISSFSWGIQVLQINDFIISTFDFYHTLLSLCENTYINSEEMCSSLGKYMIRDYIDLYTFCSKYKNKINWDEFKEMAIKYDVLNQITIVFENLFQIYEDNWVLDIKEHLKKNHNYNPYPELKWKNSFVNRIFSGMEGKIETIQQIKEKIFSKPVSPLISVSKSRNIQECDLFDTNNYYYLENKYMLDLRFLISYDESNLFLLLNMDKRMYKNLNKYIFEFRVFDNDMGSRVMTTFVDISRNENDIVCGYCNSYDSFSSNDLRANELFKRCNGEIINFDEISIIKTAVPFKDLLIDVSKPLLKVAYCLTLLKKVYEHVYQPICSSAKSFFDNNIVEIKVS